MRVPHLLRALIRVPAFTALVVFTLALGIAANTAIFSVIQAVRSSATASASRQLEWPAGWPLQRLPLS